MPHIHTKPGQHDHTASAFIVRTDFAEPKIMLHKHKKLGVYMQFGGHIELSETPWQAISHEIPEETGYNMGQLMILQPKQRLKKVSRSILHPIPVCHNTHMIVDSHYHTDLDYAFVTNEPPKGKVGEGESNDIKLFTLAELLAHPANDIFQEVADITLFIFDVCLPEWERLKTNEFK